MVNAFVDADYTKYQEPAEMIEALKSPQAEAWPTANPHRLRKFCADFWIPKFILSCYNSSRLHSYLGYKSPNQYELEATELKKLLNWVVTKSLTTSNRAGRIMGHYFA